jgi:DHA1 family multidrug resistance protein-like MFS transporter
LKAIWRNVRDASYLFPGMFAQTFAITSLVPILSLYAKLVLHLSPTLYSSILVGGGLVTTVTLLPAGKLVDRYGPRRFLIGGFGLAAAALILFSFYHTTTSTFLVVAMIGLGYGMVLPSWNKTVDSNIDPDKKATLWGIFMTVEGIGSAVGPYIGGTVWDAISPQAPFWVAGSVILGICLLYALMPSHAGHARSYDKLV